MIMADNGKSLQNVQVVACKTLESVTFNEHNILFAMRKLKPKLSSGPDGLPPLLFKKLQYVLATPLALVLYLLSCSQLVLFQISGNKLLLSQFLRKEPHVMLLIIAAFL